MRGDGRAHDRALECDRRREDEVYHLGDVAHLEHAGLAETLARLNGRLHLILGNNDRRETMEATGRWETIAEMRELTIGAQRIFLCHYPLREWPNAWRGAWHLFGHVHGKYDKDPHGLSLDVGVDSHAYAPMSLEAIAQRLQRAAAAVAGKTFPPLPRVSDCAFCATGGKFRAKRWRGKCRRIS